MTDFSHLDAIQQRLYREKARLAAATNENERRFREVQVMHAERELAAEYEFLGLGADPCGMSDDELLAELQG